MQRINMGLVLFDGNDTPSIDNDWDGEIVQIYINLEIVIWCDADANCKMFANSYRIRGYMYINMSMCEPNAESIYDIIYMPVIIMLGHCRFCY